MSLNRAHLYFDFKDNNLSLKFSENNDNILVVKGVLMLTNTFSHEKNINYRRFRISWHQT
ncbi:MAG: hypothetical protein RL711_1363 [Bacteroidota bacterium]|jgi:hypothetical protein